MQIQNVIIEETKQKLEVREKQEAGVFYANIASMPLQPGQSISLKLDFVTEIPNQKKIDLGIPSMVRMKSIS